MVTIIGVVINPEVWIKYSRVFNYQYPVRDSLQTIVFSIKEKTLPNWNLNSGLLEVLASTSYII